MSEASFFGIDQSDEAGSFDPAMPELNLPTTTDGGGVFATTAERDSVVHHLERVGWRTAILSGSADKRGVLAKIGQALNFPDYYGANLDALDECLAEQTEPTALVWVDGMRMAESAPEDFQSIAQVLFSHTQDEVPFAVVVLYAAPDA